ncbi:MAG: heavy metal translocating P-type ATPase [Roseiflexaceae bacterium]
MPDTIAFACTVDGMCCAAEAGPIERAVRALPGVRQVVADPALARLSVTYDATALAPERIVAQVERLGFRVATTDRRPPTADHSDLPATSLVLRLSSFINKRPRDLLTVVCGLLILAAWLGGLLGVPTLITRGLYIFATLAGGVFVARSGWTTLRAARVLDINALMTIAALGALLIGEYAEGAAVVFLFALGNALEGYTMERSRRSIRALMRLAPETALVLRDGAERVVPAGEVAVGEVFVVRPGDRIALDGLVVAGHSAVDQAPITGESVPVEKEAGAAVFAGSINGEGALEVRAARPAQDSTLARIIHLVEQAQSHKAPTQRFVDVFARRYTPAVLVLAALVAVLPPLTVGGWAEWLYRALVLLVIACPCALVISTPVSIVSAISAAARAGVLFKGGAALEAAGDLRALAFDKTGTLTLGRPVVTDVVVFDDRRPTTDDRRVRASSA